MKLFIKILNIILSIIGAITLLGILAIVIIALIPQNNDQKLINEIKKNNYKYIEKVNIRKIKEKNDYNILNTACETGDIKTIEIIIKKYEKLPINFILSIANYTETVIDYLLSNGIDINSFEEIKYGNIIEDLNTPLTFAISNNSVSKFLYLINKGAKIDLGFPLHRAANIGNYEIFKYLIKTININQKNLKGETPIMSCLQPDGPHSFINNGQLRILNLLLENNAEVSILNNNNENLLHYAVKTNILIVQKFLELGLDINHKNNEGFYPIQMMDNPNDYNEDMYQFLLDNGSKKIELGNW